MHLSFCNFRDLLTYVHMSLLGKTRARTCIYMPGETAAEQLSTASPQSSSSYTLQCDYFHLAMQNTLHVVAQKQDMFVASAACETH